MSLMDQIGKIGDRAARSAAPEQAVSPAAGGLVINIQPSGVQTEDIRPTRSQEMIDEMTENVDIVDGSDEIDF